MTDLPPVIEADWPAPQDIVAFTTTRAGGVSVGPYAGLNLGSRCGDSPEAVAENRRLLQSRLPAGQVPAWLRQVHGNKVVELSEANALEWEADASVGNLHGHSCVVQTADCLPILLVSIDGAVGGAVHGGWRGLHAGVLQNAVAALPAPAANIMAWLGPAIGQQAFEVGPEVRAAFVESDKKHVEAFEPGRKDRWHADLYRLARQILRRIGVRQVYGGGWCTYSDPQLFSYRRSATCGRMATVIARR